MLRPLGGSKTSLCPLGPPEPGRISVCLVAPCPPSGFPIGYLGTSKHRQGGQGLGSVLFGAVFRCLSLQFLRIFRAPQHFRILITGSARRFSGSEYSQYASQHVCIQTERAACVCSPVTGREGRGKEESAGACLLPA